MVANAASVPVYGIRLPIRISASAGAVPCCADAVIGVSEATAMNDAESTLLIGIFLGLSVGTHCSKASHSPARFTVKFLGGPPYGSRTGSAFRRDRAVRTPGLSVPL